MKPASLALQTAVVWGVLLASAGCASMQHYLGDYQTKKVSTQGGSFSIPKNCQWINEMGDDSYVGRVRCPGLPEIRYDIGMFAVRCGRDGHVFLSGKAGEGCATCWTTASDTVRSVVASCGLIGLWTRTSRPQDTESLAKILERMAMTFEYR